jgi:hypothetical protein
VWPQVVGSTTQRSQAHDHHFFRFGFFGYFFSGFLGLSVFLLTPNLKGLIKLLIGFIDLIEDLFEEKFKVEI